MVEGVGVLLVWLLVLTMMMMMRIMMMRKTCMQRIRRDFYITFSIFEHSARF